MNKIFIFLKFSFLVLILFSACGKKSNTRLAQNYYKLSILELGEEQEVSQQAYKRSLEFIDKAIEQDSRAEYLAFKATLLFKLNQEQEGYDYFQKALQACNDSRVNSEILNNKACLLAEFGLQNNDKQKVRQALGIWKKLKDDKDYLTPEVALFNLSKIYLSDNDYVSAKNSLIDAVNISPNYLDARYYLAMVAYTQKDYKLATNEVGTILFLEPSHKGAKELKDVLAKN